MLAPVAMLLVTNPLTAQAPILPKAPQREPSTIYLERLDIPIELGELVNDVEALPRLTETTIKNCIVDEAEQDVLIAFMHQLADASHEDCAANAYFTQRSLRTYLRQLGLKQPSSRTECVGFDEALSTEFAMKELDALKNGACTYSLPLQRCEVSTKGGRLRFRSFPHIVRCP